jgi:tetratricopeptide (TPR) repeat protein
MRAAWLRREAEFASGVLVTAKTTKDRLRQRLRSGVPRKPMLIGLSSVTVGIAGLLYELDRYVAGCLVLATGGVLGAASEWLTRQTRYDLDERSASPHRCDLDGSHRDGQIWSIPRPTATFAGRNSDLARLKRRLARSSTSLAAVALHGVPGLGKTQLAMAYAERHRSDFNLGWWLNGSSRLWVVAGLAELAGQLGVAVNDQEQAARAAVAELGRRGRWLLIIDDALDQVDLDGLMPNGPGQVIITSRNPSWSSVASTYEVSPFSTGDAVKLLLAHSGDGNKEAAAVIADQMHGLPLALVQAGTYCRSGAITLDEYAQRFRTSQARLLEEGSPGPYPLTVAVTVRLVLAQLRRESLVATQLLYLFACLGPTGVPHDLPAHAPHVLPWRLARVAQDPVSLDKATQVLVRTSLVSPDRPGHLRMHSVVQEIVRADVDRRTNTWWQRAVHRCRTIGDNGNAWGVARWLDAVGLLLLHAFPADTEDLSGWTRCAELQPHLDAYAGLAEQHGSDGLMLADVCERLASYLGDRGEVAAAEHRHSQTFSLREKILGSEHPKTLTPLHHLGLMLTRRGDYRQSAERLRQLYSVQLRTGGPTDPATLGTQLRLAFAVFELGELREAERLARNVWHFRRDNLGEDHNDTLQARFVLGAVLQESKLDEASQHNAAVHQVFDEIYGREHLRNLMAWHNWARNRAEVGAYEQARSEFEEILSVTSRVHGPRHPLSLFAQHNLARTRWLEGAELNSVQAHFEATLAAREEVMGPRHPKTLTTRHYLARVLAKQGDVEAAEKQLLRIIECRQSVLGHRHPQTMLAVEDLERLRTSGTMSVNGVDAARRLRPDLTEG